MSSPTVAAENTIMLNGGGGGDDAHQTPTVGGRKKTFRARRLTITRNDSITANVAAAAAAAALSCDSHSDEYDSPGEEEQLLQQRDRRVAKGNLRTGNGITAPKSPEADGQPRTEEQQGDDTTAEKSVETSEKQSAEVDGEATKTTGQVVNGNGEGKPPDSDNKSRTFRERRLTFTKHQVTAAIEKLASASWAQDLSDDDDDDENERKKTAPTSYPSKKVPSEASRNRRSSTASTCTTTEEALRSRTIHAGELLRVPLDSPASALKRSKLYMGPFRADYDDDKEDGAGAHGKSHNDDEISDLEADEDAADDNDKTTTLTPPSSSLQRKPLWKRRMTRRHSELDCSLPFPRHVVGTYSAHGIEPLYDIDDDELGEDDDEDELPPATVAKINQDRGGVAFPYGKSKRQALFAVYDGHGHGGELVSQFALHHVQKRLERHAQFESNLEKAFQEVFESVNADLAQEDCMDPTYAGTTACAVLIRDTMLTISNAGDSRAVLGRRITTENDGGNHNDKSNDDVQYEAIELSQDQNPDVPEERKRIEAAGGFVSDPPEPGLSARVWLDADHSQIGLAMARSIGDYAVKSIGVLATPVVTTHVLQSPQDEVLILATDGVWEFMSSQEAVDIVTSHLQTNESLMTSSSSDDNEGEAPSVGGAAKACQALIEAAANKWHKEEGDYRDDITALVVCLQQLWDHNGGNNSNCRHDTKRQKV